MKRCASVRAYLKAGVPALSRGSDFSREQLAHLAAAIAEVGRPADIADILSLLRTDIDRRRTSRDSMSYTNVYVPAIIRLDPDNREKTLIDVLAIPEYADEVSQEFARAYHEKPVDGRDRTARYDRMWAAREGRLPPPGTTMLACAMCRSALRADRAIDERGRAGKGTWPNHLADEGGRQGARAHRPARSSTLSPAGPGYSSNGTKDAASKPLSAW
jgi:hypothetical protein